MAYTGSPQFQTYKTVELKFDATTTYRSGNLATQRDSNIINMFYDRVSQENKTRAVFLKKRPGLRAAAYNMTQSVVGESLRGQYYDIASNRFYWAVNNKVYSVTPDSGTSIRTVATLVTSSGYVGFCEFLKASTNTRYVLFSDGTDLWVDNYGAGTCADVTDVDMPTPHVPQPVSINGYVFLAKANTGDLYNSDNDDPTAWTSGEFISAEMSGDYITKVTTNRNYILAFGTNSLEIFWDAANDTGSPLKRNDSGYKQVGYITGMTQNGDMNYFVGQEKSKNIGVYMINGFRMERISNEVVDRSLQNITSTDNVKGQVYTDRDGYMLSVDGHTFYVLVTPQTTWAYDVDEKMWYEWKNSSDTGLDIQGAWSMFDGAQYVAIGGQTYISLMAPNLYQDFGVNFTCQYTTENATFETFNWKVCNRVAVQCDMHDFTGTSNLQLKWSDNDWADGGTTARAINVFSSSPFLTRCGRFRNRSFRLTYADNYPLRLQGLSLDLNVLQH